MKNVIDTKSKEKNDSGSAIVCSHVAAGYPILLAERSEPSDHTDSGWQFVFDSGLDEDIETAQAWALSEVLRVEPSLDAFVDSPPGTELRRRNRTDAWKMIEVTRRA